MRHKRHKFKPQLTSNIPYQLGAGHPEPALEQRLGRAVPLAARREARELGRNCFAASAARVERLVGGGPREPRPVACEHHLARVEEPEAVGRDGDGAQGREQRAAQLLEARRRGALGEEERRVEARQLQRETQWGDTVRETQW
jgi:hypothetical protein